MKTIESVSLVTFLEGATDGFVMFGSLFNFVNGTLDKSHYKLLTQEHVDAFKSRPDVFNVVELEEKAPVEKKVEEKKAVEVKEEVKELKEELKEEKKELKVEPVVVEKEEEKVVEVKPAVKEVEKTEKAKEVVQPVEKKNSATKTKN